MCLIGNSIGWLRSTWMSLVHREIIVCLVVGSNSSWVLEYKLARGMILLVFDKILDIIFCKFTIKTLFHILDFLCLDWVIVVKGRLINKSLIECTFQEEVEIRHESGIITVLVLSKDRVQSKVDFSIFLVFLWHS